MNKLVAALIATSVVIPTAVAAKSQKSVLSEADRTRIVCVPKRDADGAIAAGNVCRTGAEWEATLRGASWRSSKTDWINSGWAGAYIANPYRDKVYARPARAF